jgi:uncharacterized membrane protein YebE (DUF533 family)
MNQLLKNEARRRAWRAWMVALGIAALLVPPAIANASQSESEKSGVSVGKTAGIGALLGLALGRSVGDVIGGAALGAAGGMIANEVIKDQDRKEAQKQQSTKAQAEQQQKQSQDLSAKQSEAAFAEAIGSDNYEGYKALRACQYERAYALAKAGATSNEEYHRLASMWLEAMTATEERNKSRAEAMFAQLVDRDPEIDTVQQAGIATDQAVLDLRTERRELGLPSCRK